MALQPIWPPVNRFEIPVRAVGHSKSKLFPTMSCSMTHYVVSTSIMKTIVIKPLRPPSGTMSPIPVTLCCSWLPSLWSPLVTPDPFIFRPVSWGALFWQRVSNFSQMNITAPNLSSIWFPFVSAALVPIYPTQPNYFTPTNSLMRTGTNPKEIREVPRKNVSCH